MRSGNGVPGGKPRCASDWSGAWASRTILLGFARVAEFAKDGWSGVCKEPGTRLEGLELGIDCQTNSNV